MKNNIIYNMNNKIYKKKFLIIIIIIAISNKEFNNNNRLSYRQKNEMIDFKTKIFYIIRRLDCPSCGFFSFYFVYLGCVKKLLSEGIIPIIDLKTFTNAYNNGNTSINNPYELFFYQPYNYTLEEVEKYAKNIHYFQCETRYDRPNERYIYYNKDLITFWHNFAKIYCGIKNEIMIEAKIHANKLFRNSKNILGVKLRGTDYNSLKPKSHSIQPKPEQVILDVKYMDKKYKYDFIFFSTEDESIKQKFTSYFGYKLKLLNPNVAIKYSNKDKYEINSHKNIYGNLSYSKNYLLNIIILSTCLDIITSKCNGAAAIFIFSNGFRHIKIYDLGIY